MSQATTVAVISYGFWQHRFHLDRSAIGQSVVSNDVPFTIVGVADSNFFGERFERSPDFWLPLSTQPQVLQRDTWSNGRAMWLTARDVYWLNCMGRLKPGVTLESAQASVNLHLRQFYSEQAGSRLSPGTRRKIENIRVELKPGGYQPDQLFPLYRELGDRFHQLPGVISASLARFAPESGNTSYYKFAMAGYSPGPGKKMDLSDLSVGPHFFETLGIPQLRGRAIDARVTPASSPVAIVNETFVRQYSRNQNPLGRRISLGSPFKEPGFEIVGVVADSKYHDLREKVQPMGFFSIWQRPTSGFELVLRTSAAPEGIAAARRALDQTNNRLPVLHVTSLNLQVEQSLKQQKMITSLCSISGAVALILASIGIYGTFAYSVAGRVTEIGIRMAIGAQRSNVIWLVLRDSALFIAIGVFVGLPLALIGTRWIKSFLFGVPAVDPLSVAAAVLLIVILGLMAGYFPGRRAARIDPMRALRHE